VDSSNLDVRTQKGYVRGDQTVTTSVEYLDLTDFLGSREWVWVRITPIDIGLYYLFVESATPAVAPTVALVTTNGAMDYIPNGATLSVRLYKSNPILAYAGSASGKFRVARG
jgi:hypothetical protein